MDKKNSRGAAFSAYGKRVNEWLPLALALVLVTASCAALSLLGSLWTLLGIALFFLPTLFAATQYIGASYSGKEGDTRVITRLFGAYFRSPYIGVYRFLINAFYSVAATLGTSLVFVVMYYSFASAFDASFISAAENIANLISLGDYDAANKAMSEATAFKMMYDISEILMGFALVGFCWLFMGKYMQNGVVRNAFHLDNGRIANFYYGFYRRAVKKDWVPARAPFLAFPLSFLLIGGAVSGLCYGYGVNVRFSAFFGLLTFAVLFSFYLPLSIYLNVDFAFAHQSAIGKAFYAGSQKIYRSLAASGTVSDEELAKMREDLDKMKPSDEDEKK